MQQFNTTGNVQVDEKPDLIELDKPVDTVTTKPEPKFNKEDIPLEVQNLADLLNKDGFTAKDLYKLRTFFIACSFTDQGLASSVEFETIVTKSN